MAHRCPQVNVDRRNATRVIDGQRDWFVNSQGQSFAVIRGPVEARLGSPGDEPDREAIEILSGVTIDRSFAIGMKEVTSEEFKRFLPKEGSPQTFEWGPEYPACRMNYFQAAQYCRWLSEQEGIPEDQMCYLPSLKLKKDSFPTPTIFVEQATVFRQKPKWNLLCEPCNNAILLRRLG